MRGVKLGGGDEQARDGGSDVLRVLLRHLRGAGQGFRVEHRVLRRDVRGPRLFKVFRQRRRRERRLDLLVKQVRLLRQLYQDTRALTVRRRLVVEALLRLRQVEGDEHAGAFLGQIHGGVAAPHAGNLTEHVIAQHRERPGRLLEGVGRRFDPVGRGAVRGEAELGPAGAEVEDDGGFLKVHVRDGHPLVRLEGVRPGERDVDVTRLLADWEPRLHDAQRAIVRQEGLPSLLVGLLVHHNLGSEQAEPRQIFLRRRRLFGGERVLDVASDGADQVHILTLRFTDGGQASVRDPTGASLGGDEPAFSGFI